MKKIILISNILFFFSLAVNAQTVNKDNIMDYVKSEKSYEQWTDNNYIVYEIVFVDGEKGTVYYNKKKSIWYSDSGLIGSYIGKTKKEAILWLYKNKH